MKKLFTLLAAMGFASAFMAQAVSIQDVRKVDTFNSVAGAWDFTIQYVDGTTAKAGYPTYYASLQDRNVVQFDDDTKNFWSFNGIYSPSTKKITFTREYIGDASGLYVYQEPVVISDKGELEYKSYSAQVSDDFFTISFEQDCGMIWAAYSDEQGTNLVEVYAMYDFIKAERPLNEKNWKDVGMAKFMDGWVLPALGFNQYENEYEVKLQQYDGNENLYRLVDPYKTGPAAEFNTSRTGGYIQFDVTDPEHVVFTKSNAGFSHSGLGISTFYTFNMLGYYLYNYPTYTAEEIIQMQPMPFTTFQDGVVSLEYYTNENRVKVYDANYGTQLVPNGGQVWQYGSGERVDMTTTITFPKDNAVESVFGDDENAPVEYFNLQGLRVINPQPGQLLIKRQGSKASKIIF